jgi:predicted DNA-binding protein with PD1-like motif
MKAFWAILSLATVLAAGGCGGPARHNDSVTHSGTKGGTATMASAPEVYTVSGNFERIVVVRLKRGMDLLDGLKKAVAKEKIRNAAILSGVGSLTSYHVHAVSNTTLPAQNIYYKGEGPQDLLNVNGYVMDGRVHAHIVFSDNQKGLGGHLEPGTTVFTFAIITLGVLPEGADLTRFDEPGW